MKIVFVLPGYAKYPSGGFKVIYEYAVQFAHRQHQVFVTHADVIFNGVSLREYPIRVGGYVLRRLKLSYGPGEWYPMDASVRMLTVPTLAARYAPDADVVIATSWHTAEYVAQYPPSKGAKIYFVQDYEHLMTASNVRRRRMERTYLAGFTIVTISPVIHDFLQTLGVDSTVIANALNHEMFFLEVALDDPLREWIGFPYRPEPYKGTDDIISCLRQVRDNAGLKNKIWAFGAVRSPKLPPWINYVYRPSDRDLRAWYNRTRIFVVGSHFEGWGLPGMEAMACGAALVTTDNGGVRAYAQHEVNALMSPPRNPTALAHNVARLMRNDGERRALALQGFQSVQDLTWERSSDRFLEILEVARTQRLSTR